MKNQIGFIRPLSEFEMIRTRGGSRFSRAVFWTIGYAFESINQAAMNGAPRGNTFKHSG